MFLIITRDTMFFTAMKNILSKGNVVHIQNEEEIDVMLHQNAFVIIDTLMNNVFHSNFLTQIERLKPVHVIIFSPFNIKRCLGKVPVTFVPRTIAIIDFVALINGSYCSVPEADVSLSRKQHQVLSCIANQMTTEDILEKLKISLKTFYCHKHNIMMILNLKRINELVRHQHINYLVLTIDQYKEAQQQPDLPLIIRYAVTPSGINEAICLRHCACSCSPSVR